MKRAIQILALLVAASSTFANDEISVVASELRPCVINNGESLAGFAIDLWKALADVMQAEYSLTTTDISGALQAVTQGEADVAIGCISITHNREKQLDFTHPVAEGGLQAVTHYQRGVLPRFSAQSKYLLLFLLALVVFFAHLMWWSERGQPAIHDAYFPGIVEAIWFSVVTMSTVGYGDIAPRKWLGRIGALLIILLGVTTFGFIVGQFAADAVKPQALNPVESIQDLHKYRIGTRENTATTEFLMSRGIDYSGFETLEEAIAAMLSNRVDVVLHDTVAIQYQIHRHSDLIETGPTFNAHHLGFAVPQGSELTEEINVALLKLQENGRYETILNRWFSWNTAED